MAKYFQAQHESEKLRLNLEQAETELALLRDESKANADAALQRKAFHAQLSLHPQLKEENENLRRENRLLIETAENSQVLLEKVKSLEMDLARALHEVAEGDKVKQDLVELKKKMRQWERAGLQLLSSEERLAIGEMPLSVDTFAQKAAHWQHEMAVNTEEIGILKSRFVLNIRFLTFYFF